MTFLGSLLHICDSTLPIGGYAHSGGLETYIQQGTVFDAESAEQFVIATLSNNLKYNDAALCALAYQATAADNLRDLISLDNECTALKTPLEMWQASQKLGLRFIKIFERQEAFPIAKAFSAALSKRDADGNYPIVFGMYACLLQIPLKEAIYAFYYNAAVGIITNAVKLVPLGQLSGQDILYRLQKQIAELIEPTLALDRDLVGVCNVGFDIRCMQHERLYSRLYMS